MLQDYIEEFDEIIWNESSNVNIPTLWLYSENDIIISLDYGEKFFNKYFKDYGNYHTFVNIKFPINPTSEDIRYLRSSHQFFKYPPIWEEYVNKFLEET